MNMAYSLDGLDCFLIADDLTGACDAAVHFARSGRRTQVCLSEASGAIDANVVAVTTNSREVGAREIQDRLAALAKAYLLQGSPRFLFKKVDSTLRGNVGVEIAATLESFGCDIAVVCSAFPALSRVVDEGLLRIAGRQDFESVDVLALLRKQGLDRCVHTRPGTIRNAISSGARIVSVDAVCEADLDEIVSETLPHNKRVLWVGSGGLAAALARTLAPRSSNRDPLQKKTPVLFCIGSGHAVTLGQQNALLEGRNARMVLWEVAKREDIMNALEQERHVCLQVPRSEANPEKIYELIRDVPIGAIFLSGGDTASMVCQGLGVRSIELLGEIVPGVPRGDLDGGVLDGIPVATKSGAFGQVETLIKAADYFLCPNG